jgi:hypothetical protein
MGSKVRRSGKGPVKPSAMTSHFTKERNDDLWTGSRTIFIIPIGREYMDVPDWQSVLFTGDDIPHTEYSFNRNPPWSHERFHIASI